MCDVVKEKIPKIVYQTKAVLGFRGFRVFRVSRLVAFISFKAIVVWIKMTQICSHKMRDKSQNSFSSYNQIYLV